MTSQSSRALPVRPFVSATEDPRQFDGKKLRSPSDVEIDHVVPLGEAWRSGASGWDDQRRRDFANDRSAPQLNVISGPANSSKGDRDPSSILGRPRGMFGCYYARQWIGVKTKYALKLQAEEKTWLKQMLSTCT